jgi:hypothetical protein
MNKFLKIILLSPIILGLSILLIGFLLPSQWQVSRSIVINKPPQAIFGYVANFRIGWPQWSAFDGEDPTIKYTYSGPSQGTGASRSWISEKMGNGSQTITSANPAKGITFELKMENSKFTIVGNIAFEPIGNGTKVTWTDKGDAGNNIFYKYMGTMMDKMMGDTFDRSLEKLKTRLDGPAVQ